MEIPIDGRPDGRAGVVDHDDGKVNNLIDGANCGVCVGEFLCGAHAQDVEEKQKANPVRPASAAAWARDILLFAGGWCQFVHDGSLAKDAAEGEQRTEF